MSYNRRSFLKGTMATGLALGFPQIVTAQKNRIYRIALIGSGWWGTNILREAVAYGQSRVVALVDVDKRQLQKCTEEVKRWTSDIPKHYEDYREMLASERPDIVIIATPDHWHALPTIAAVQAGAHVYVEKPIGHTIMEGRAMVHAAQATGRVVQVGTHRRVAPHNLSGYQFLKEGGAGKIGMTRCFVLYGGGPEKPREIISPPKELNWGLYCGPAPLRPYSKGIHPRGFRSYLDFANGQLADWGVHWLDQVLWVMGEKHPTSVHSTGGRPIKGPAILTDTHQSSDIPDHQIVTYGFDNFTATWEHRLFSGNPEEKSENVGCYFYGTKGTFHMGWRKGWTFYPRSRGQKEIHVPAQLHKPDDQNIKELWADFIQAIETGRKPASDIETIHNSTNMSLLGMLSYKLGRSIQWDGQRETCNDAEADKLLRRDYRNPWIYPEV